MDVHGNWNWKCIRRKFTVMAFLFDATRKGLFQMCHLIVIGLISVTFMLSLVFLKLISIVYQLFINNAHLSGLPHSIVNWAFSIYILTKLLWKSNHMLLQLLSVTAQIYHHHHHCNEFASCLACPSTPPPSPKVIMIDEQLFDIVFDTLCKSQSKHVSIIFEIYAHTDLMYGRCVLFIHLNKYKWRK